jgi:hypothetical protein
MVWLLPHQNTIVVVLPKSPRLYMYITIIIEWFEFSPAVNNNNLCFVQSEFAYEGLVF